MSLKRFWFIFELTRFLNSKLLSFDHVEFVSVFGDQYLQDVGLYESQEEAVNREEVLGRLDQVEFFRPSIFYASFTNDSCFTKGLLLIVRVLSNT